MYGTRRLVLATWLCERNMRGVILGDLERSRLRCGGEALSRLCKPERLCSAGGLEPRGGLTATKSSSAKRLLWQAEECPCLNTLPVRQLAQQ